MVIGWDKKGRSIIRFIIVFALAAVAFFAAACSDGDAGDTKYNVYFIVDEQPLYIIQTSGKDIIDMPADPDSYGWAFEGWFYDYENWEEPFTYNSLVNNPITYDLYIYAKMTADEQPDTSPTSDEYFEFTQIGESNYYSISKKAGVELPKNVRLPDKYMFAMYIWGKITQIGESAFADTGITSIIIPDGYTVIGANAFNGCADLTDITLPGSVVSIGTSAFNGCSGITDITLPDSVVSVGANAFNGCAGITDITIPDSVVSIGANAFLDSGIYNNAVDNGLVYAGNWLVGYKGKVEKPKVPDGIKGIASEAFKDCADLTDITLPDSLSLLGQGVFLGCVGLTEIEIPDNIKVIPVDAFSACAELETISFSADSCLEKICKYSFKDCIALTDIDLPDSVVSIEADAFFDSGIYYNTENNSLVYADNWAVSLKGNMPTNPVLSGQTVGLADDLFYNQDNLNQITITADVKHIGNRTFFGCDSLNSVAFVADANLTSIGNSAFESCVNLTAISISAKVTNIGEKAFAGCERLASVTFGDNSELTIIGDYAFDGCKILVSVTFGDNSALTVIGDYAFNGCVVESITIPAAVKSIGKKAFKACVALKSVTFEPDSRLEFIGEEAFMYSGLTEIIIPDQVKFIEGYVFYECESLTKVTFLGNSLLQLRDSVFSHCAKLIEVNLPPSIRYIGPFTFSACSSLTEITLPSSINKIGNLAFSGCTELKSIYIYATEPPTLDSNANEDSNAFNGINPNYKIYVPAAAVDTYKAAEGWSSFVNKINPLVP